MFCFPKKKKSKRTLHHGPRDVKRSLRMYESLKLNDEDGEQIDLGLFDTAKSSNGTAKQKAYKHINGDSMAINGNLYAATSLGDLTSTDTPENFNTHSLPHGFSGSIPSFSYKMHFSLEEAVKRLREFDKEDNFTRVTNSYKYRGEIDGAIDDSGDIDVDDIVINGYKSGDVSLRVNGSSRRPDVLCTSGYTKQDTVDSGLRSNSHKTQTSVYSKHGSNNMRDRKDKTQHEKHTAKLSEQTNIVVDASPGSVIGGPHVQVNHSTSKMSRSNKTLAGKNIETGQEPYESRHVPLVHSIPDVILHTSSSAPKARPHNGKTKNAKNNDNRTGSSIVSYTESGSGIESGSELNFSHNSAISVESGMHVELEDSDEMYEVTHL